MTHKFTLSCSALLIGAGLISGQIHAAGFQLNAQSATGIGRAFAGDAVIADNASVMARNPAAMALFDETALSLGFETIVTDIEVKNATYCGSMGGCDNNNRNPADDFQSSNYDNAGGTSVAPNLHLIVPINQKVAVGANIYSNFGTSTEFDDSFVGSEFGGTTDVMSLNVGIAGSYRLSQKISLGFGLDLIYGKGEMERVVSDKLSSLAELAFGTTTAIKAEADGWGVGFNLGTVYEINENNRLGFAYHYSPKITAEGDVEFLGEQYSELSLPLPEMLEISGYHRLDSTKFALHYSVQYIGWAVFDKITTNETITVRDYEWQDGMHYSLGGTYYLNDDWTLRAGYMYDTSAQDELTSVSVPDSDRQWFSAGFTFHIDSKSNLDFGLTYLVGEDVEVSESYELDGLTLSTIEATTRANAVLVGLQYSRSF